MVDGCGMTRICSYVSELLDQAMNTLRQKYREIYYEKEAKAGVKQGRCKRRELVVEEVFAVRLGAAQHQPVDDLGARGEPTLRAGHRHLLTGEARAVPPREPVQGVTFRHPAARVARASSRTPRGCRCAAGGAGLR